MAGRKPGPGFVIHNFKKPPQKNTEEIRVESWNRLSGAIEEIFQKNAGELSFEELYRTGYNLVLNRQGEFLYKCVVDTLRERSLSLQTRVCEARDEALLPTLVEVWSEYRTSIMMVRDILMYMDRTFVQQQRKTATYDIGVGAFRQHVARHPPLLSRVQRCVLDTVKSARNGEVVDKTILKSVTSMFQELGRDVYSEDFQQPFLEETSLFYRAEAQQFIETNSCPDYLLKAETRINEELELCQRYLHNSTTTALRATVETELIQRNMQSLIDMKETGPVAMLRSDRFSDLKRTFELFQGVQGGSELLRDVVCTHLKELGTELVNDPAHVADHKIYVEALLALLDKYHRFLTDSFAENKNYQNGINNAFEYFINLNNRSPEFISLYMDNMLRPGSKGSSAKGDDQLEAQVEKVMTLFRFLQEKDVFERYYKQHLAKRLLSDRSASDDLEKHVLAKLKQECGVQFTSKLEGMFNDIRNSSQLMRKYKEHLQTVTEGTTTDTAATQSKRLELAMKVLTTGFWPSAGNSPCKPPPIVTQACQAFERFYFTIHTGRVLTWHFNMGTCDLRARYPKQTYEITVPTYQMMVLLMFNNADTVAYTDIAEATGIPPSDLKRSLQSLACGKARVITKHPKGREINDTDTFTFNEGFTSRSVKFKISSVVATRETEEQKAKTQSKVDEDRKPQIDAAIVRVMKSRKIMEHSNLIADVCVQVKSRFNPNPHLIKQRIESLIEREFIERLSSDIRQYQYLA